MKKLIMLSSLREMYKRVCPSSRAPRSGAWRSRLFEIASLPPNNVSDPPRILAGTAPDRPSGTGRPSGRPPLDQPAFARNDGRGSVRLISCLAMTFAIATLFCSTTVFAGSITGKVNFTGTAPAPEQISMNADPVCASLHSGPVYAETVVVNDNGTLQHVFVYVKEGLEGKAFEAPATPVSIDQNGCHYVPHVFGIQVGQTLEIINSDATLHNIHSLAEKSKQFNLGMPLQGMKLTKKFENPEVMVKLKCDVHPWMSAYIGVLPHPFFGVSGTDGTFEIKDLPPGEYTIEAWHEKYGVQVGKVTVGEGAANVEFTFTAT